MPQVCPPPAATVVNATYTANGLLVAPARPGDVTANVYPLPRLSTRRSANVAIPFTVSTVVVPCSFAPVGFAASASVTGALARLRVLPRES